MQVHSDSASFFPSVEAANVNLSIPLVTLATDVGAVSLLKDVATLEDIKMESYTPLERPLLLESDPSGVDVHKSLNRLVVRASLLTLFLRISFIFGDDDDNDASALCAEATREM